MTFESGLHVSEEERRKTEYTLTITMLLIYVLVYYFKILNNNMLLVIIYTVNFYLFEMCKSNAYIFNVYSIAHYSVLVELRKKQTAAA